MGFEKTSEAPSSSEKSLYFSNGDLEVSSRLKNFVCVYTGEKRRIKMAVPSVSLSTRNKKHFLGVPAPLGYVAGVGRG